MDGQCTTFDHTADVGLDARADSLEQLLTALADGLRRVIHQPDGVDPRQTRTLQLEADEIETLTVDLLWQLMDLIQVELFLIASVEVQVAQLSGACRLEARVAGEPYDAGRHVFNTEIKAVTYHLLQVRQDEQGVWRGRVILDL